MVRSAPDSENGQQKYQAELAAEILCLMRLLDSSRVIGTILGFQTIIQTICWFLHIVFITKMQDQLQTRNYAIVLITSLSHLI